MSGGFLSKTWALVVKDLRLELRGRDTLPPMIAFAGAVALLLAFSIPSAGAVSAPGKLAVGSVRLADVLAGFLWVTILFAGLIGFARTFDVEREEGAMDSLLLAPVDRSGLFFGKALPNLAFIVVVEAILIPLFALLFGVRLATSWPALILVTLLTDLGFVAIGTLFSALAAQTKSRELILPILALPVLVPVFIGAVVLTSDLFVGGSLGEVAQRGWFVILITFDVVFIVVGALLFEFTLQ
ncbi:MAG: heme exporter protein CcmB [Actinomycetota bacterium]|nr:heme exporter protein CcmB [Actinomycetota bacterium]